MRRTRFFLRQFPLLIENRREVCYIYMYISTGILCLLSKQTRRKNFMQRRLYVWENQSTNLEACHHFDLLNRDCTCNVPSFFEGCVCGGGRACRAAEDGTAAEDAQPEVSKGKERAAEEALPEVGAAGLSEGSAEVDAGLNTAPEDDAAYVNAGSEAFGDAAEETSADALAESEAKASEKAVQTEAAANAESEEKAGKEAAETEAPADTESGEKTVNEAVKADEAAPADSAAETADAGKSADAEQSGSAAETADAGKSADAEQSGSTAGTADAGNSTEAGTTDSEEVNSGSEGEGSLVKAGETVDPLTYLAECLQYHGDELNPSAYSLRAYTEDGQSIVTEVKDQTPWQTCWGFSAIAASESSILAECYAKWDELAPGLLEKLG